MKEVVEKSKQTVWVLTMVTVMVVLSAYYLLSDPLISKNAFENGGDKTDNVVTELNTDEISSKLDTSNVVDVELSSDLNKNGDLILGLKMERTNSRQKQIDQLYTMLNNSNLSEEGIATIQDKIDQLQTVDESEFVLEKLIMADGYNDAAVLSNDKNADVMIQASNLSNAEAVKIIKMVSERLEIPAINVHIKIVK